MGGAPKMADGVWKGVQPQVIGHFKQLLLNKFFDPSTPSMRKVDDGEKEKKKRKENTSLAAPGALAHRLQRRTACTIQNGRQGPPKWPTGSGKGSNPRLLAILSNFR